MTIDEPREYHPDDPSQARTSAAGTATDDDVSDLAGQLGLPKDQTQAALDVVLAELETGNQRDSATEDALSQGAAGERFSIGDLLQAMGSGTATSQEGKQKPDLTEFAKDELAKAVAKKLGIDPATAGPIVETLLEHVLGKQTPTKRRRKTPKSTPKRPASSSSSASSKRRKAKKPSASSASASAKPAAKKRRRRTSASSGTASSAAAAKPARRKRPSSSSSSKRKTNTSKRPASSSSTSKRKQARRRSATRSTPEVVVSE